jgi:hypothetical protein
MKKTLLACIVVAASFISCSKDASDIADSPSMQATPTIPTGYYLPNCVIPVEVANLAGQTINVGNITVWNDETNVYVYYHTTDAHRIKKTHLYVGSNSGIPVNNAGNPRIGQYPYTTSHGTAGVQDFTYVIPRSSLPAGCIVISAHSEVIGAPGNSGFGQETGWGQGSQINDGGSWAMKFDYCQQDCTDDDR